MTNGKSTAAVAADVRRMETLALEHHAARAAGTARERSMDGAGGAHRRLAVNAAAGGIANFLKIGVQLVMLPLMARLLGPSEFGLYALALPTISFFMILADGGLAASLARESTDATLVWSTAFWLVMIIGVVLATIVTAWGFGLAALVHEPRVSGLMAMLSISLVMIAVSALPSARLTREGRLVVFAAADCTSTFVGAALAVGLAASGAGAKSLAVQYVTYYTLRAAILNAAAFVRPRRQFRLSALAGHLSTGSALLGSKLADFSGRLIENVLYGRTFGAAGLGVFTFANQAPRFICEATSGPVWAALYAHALREDDTRVRNAHVNLVRLLACLVFPVAALLSATAPEILGVILGPKWDAASTLLRILIPFYALIVVSAQSGAVLLAKGRGWLLFWLATLVAILRNIAVALSPWIGQIGVAYGIGAAMVIHSYFLFVAPGRGARSLVMAIIPPALASAAAGLLCYASARLVNGGLPWIAVCWLLGAAAYVIVLVALQWKTIGEDFAALRGLALGRGEDRSNRRSHGIFARR
jgi:PST family polysaccharide transporter